MNLQSNAAFISAFGEEVKIHTQSRLLRVSAIVEPDTEVDHLQTVQINHQSLRIFIPQGELKNKGVERRQKVELSGESVGNVKTIFSITEIGNDMMGMAVIRVSRT
jgi:hypothetical protein